MKDNWLYEEVVCADGFTVSIQASSSHYCYPRRDDADEYVNVELGFPSEPDDLIQPYAEDAHWPCDTVYGFVPHFVVRQLLAKHGGVVSGEIPPLKEGDEEE